MTNDQGTGVIERVIYGVILGVLMKLVAAGWLTADMAPYLAGAAVSAVGGAYALWINRPKAIVQSAAALSTQGFPGTTVVTSAALAAATPESNIVSNLDQKVVSK